MDQIILGQEGEAIACTVLSKNGYRILERNFRNRLGEIDVIAQEKGHICFIEIKTRHILQCGSPFEAVSKFKQRQIVRVAKSYLRSKRWEDRRCRFDVVGITVDDSDQPKIEILQDAFQLETG